MASIIQKCKTDPKNKHYPCEKVRCGRPWTVRYREPGGRTARQREKTFPRKVEAEALASKVENQKNEGLYIDPALGRVTMRFYASEWLEQQDIHPSTRQNYSSFIRLHLIPHLGRKTIAGVTRKDLTTFVIKLGDVLAASTIQDRMKMVSAVFKTAVAEKRRPDNPAEGVKVRRVPTVAVDDDTIPTLDEVHGIAEHISPQYRLSVWLQAGAGLRISEALAFNTGCPRGDFLRIRWQVSTKANLEDCKTRFVPLKHRAEGDYRDVPMAPFIGEEIDLHLALWGTRTVAGFEVYFSPRERGKGLMPTANTYSYHFRKAQVQAGIVDAEGKPKYTPHSLRHFFASTALSNLIPISELSAWLGHRSIKTTVDIYGHIVPGAWDRCRSAIQEAMQPDRRAAYTTAA